MTNYADQVAAAAAALTRGEDANWELARLTFENTRAHGHGEQPGRVTMEQWCADVSTSSHRRFGKATGHTYKRIWERFGDVALHLRPSWTEALYEVRPGSSPEQRHEREGARYVRDATPERKVEIARELLSQPEVAEQIADEITDYVASSPERTSRVIRKRQDDAGIPQAQPRPVERDYDSMVERGTDLLGVALAAESSGRWQPSERSEALLYFLTQVLGERRAPSGDEADLVNAKLDELFAEVEQYANAEVS